MKRQQKRILRLASEFDIMWWAKSWSTTASATIYRLPNGETRPWTNTYTLQNWLDSGKTMFLRLT